MKALGFDSSSRSGSEGREVYLLTYAELPVANHDNEIDQIQGLITSACSSAG